MLQLKVIRHIASYIAKPLTHIFKSSYRNIIIPDAFKTTLVKSVYKANDKENKSN